MAPEVESEQRTHYHDDDEVQAMENWAQRGEIAPYQRPDKRQEQTPGERTKKGIHAERAKRHAGDPGGQRDVGPHHRQEAREEGRRASVFVEKGIGSLRIVLRDEDIAAILEHDWSPSPVANPIRGDRAAQTSKGASQSDQE